MPPSGARKDIWTFQKPDANQSLLPPEQTATGWIREEPPSPTMAQQQVRSEFLKQVERKLQAGLARPTQTGEEIFRQREAKCTVIAEKQVPRFEDNGAEYMGAATTGDREELLFQQVLMEEEVWKGNDTMKALAVLWENDVAPREMKQAGVRSEELLRARDATQRAVLVVEEKRLERRREELMAKKERLAASAPDKAKAEAAWNIEKMLFDAADWTTEVVAEHVAELRSFLEMDERRKEWFNGCRPVMKGPEVIYACRGDVVRHVPVAWEAEVRWISRLQRQSFVRGAIKLQSWWRGVSWRKMLLPATLKENDETRRQHDQKQPRAGGLARALGIPPHPAEAEAAAASRQCFKGWNEQDVLSTEMREVLRKNWFGGTKYFEARPALTAKGRQARHGTGGLRDVLDRWRKATEQVRKIVRGETSEGLQGMALPWAQIGPMTTTTVDEARPEVRAAERWKGIASVSGLQVGALNRTFWRLCCPALGTRFQVTLEAVAAAMAAKQAGAEREQEEARLLRQEQEAAAVDALHDIRLARMQQWVWLLRAEGKILDSQGGVARDQKTNLAVTYPRYARWAPGDTEQDKLERFRVDQVDKQKASEKKRRVEERKQCGPLPILRKGDELQLVLKSAWWWWPAAATKSSDRRGPPKRKDVILKKFEPWMDRAFVMAPEVNALWDGWLNSMLPGAKVKMSVEEAQGASGGGAAKQYILRKFRGIADKAVPGYKEATTGKGITITRRIEAMPQNFKELLGKEKKELRVAHYLMDRLPGLSRPLAKVELEESVQDWDSTEGTGSVRGAGTPEPDISGVSTEPEPVEKANPPKEPQQPPQPKPGPSGGPEPMETDQPGDPQPRPDLQPTPMDTSEEGLSQGGLQEPTDPNTGEVVGDRANLSLNLDLEFNEDPDSESPSNDRSSPVFTATPSSGFKLRPDSSEEEEEQREMRGKVTKEQYAAIKKLMQSKKLTAEQLVVHSMAGYADTLNSEHGWKLTEKQLASAFMAVIEERWDAGVSKKEKVKQQREREEAARRVAERVTASTQTQARAPTPTPAGNTGGARPKAPSQVPQWVDGAGLAKAKEAMKKKGVQDEEVDKLSDFVKKLTLSPITPSFREAGRAREGREMYAAGVVVDADRSRKWEEDLQRKMNAFLGSHGQITRWDQADPQRLLVEIMEEAQELYSAPQGANMKTKAKCARAMEKHIRKEIADLRTAYQAVKEVARRRKALAQYTILEPERIAEMQDLSAPPIMRGLEASLAYELTWGGAGERKFRLSVRF